MQILEVDITTELEENYAYILSLLFVKHEKLPW